MVDSENVKITYSLRLMT